MPGWTDAAGAMAGKVRIRKGFDVMETITLQVGLSESLRNGMTQDGRREVQFTGERLAHRTEYGEGRDGRLTDTRGVTQTLYRAEDGRLLVHTKAWSQWAGEPTDETLQTVEEEDLQTGGFFELLGLEAGYGRPLTLDEALIRFLADGTLSPSAYREDEILTGTTAAE